MSNIVRLSDATALALHSMMHLAVEREAHSTTASIAELYGVSRHHLAKVHQRLTRAGLIRSRRGPAGGVELGKEPEEILLLEIYEVTEGSLVPENCLLGKDECPRELCFMRNLLPAISEQIEVYFKNTTLAEAVAFSEWKPICE